MSLPSRERGLKYDDNMVYTTELGRSPRGSADWNSKLERELGFGNVAPLAGARIEIWWQHGLHNRAWSLPSRERGLKSIQLWLRVLDHRRSPRGSADWNAVSFWLLSSDTAVAPLAGARIEILLMVSSSHAGRVAPLAGARIEIFDALFYFVPRGEVAPLAGARIEI